MGEPLAVPRALRGIKRDAKIRSEGIFHACQARIRALEAEILVLRHQLSVLRRKAPARVSFSNIDRLVFAGSIVWLLGCWTL